MAVRVRLRGEAGGRVREVVALVNSGHEADTPQLMVPIGLARGLGLWPPPPDAREELFDTAGGPVRVWVVRGAAAVRAVAEDAESARRTRGARPYGDRNRSAETSRATPISTRVSL